jgi:uncharacterized protein (TIGR03067 family)
VVDPSKEPRTIDRLIKSPDGTYVSVQGIYTFDGGTLKICEQYPTLDPATAMLTKRERPRAFRALIRSVLLV